MKLIILAVAVSSITATAQDKPVPQVFIESRFVETNVKLVANIGLDFAISDFSKSHSFAPGVGFGAYFKVNKNIMWGANLDEHYFLGKKVPGTDNRYKAENILRITTNILIRNNSSSVIMGLNAGIAHTSTKGYRETNFTWGVSAGVPIAGKLPLLGRLFDARNKKAAGANLLIFITPKVSGDNGDR